VRVPVAEIPAWRERAADPEEGGPFASLPVLDWNGHRVAQTLAIAGYLDAKLGHEARFPSLEACSFQRMVASAAHLDMQAVYSGLLWLPADAPDEQLRGVTRSLLRNLEKRLAQLERVHGEAAHGLFFAGEAPALADFFVYESIDRARSVFGIAFEGALAQCRHMGALAEAMDARPGIASCTAPEQVTGSPSELELRTRLPALI
jgi:glutathione S-transferase